jgi:hypothetical protein
MCYPAAQKKVGSVWNIAKDQVLASQLDPGHFVRSLPSPQPCRIENFSLACQAYNTAKKFANSAGSSKELLEVEEFSDRKVH